MERGPKEELAVCCAADERYAQHAGVMICSLLSNNRAIRELYLVDTDLSQESRDRLLRICDTFSSHIRWVPVDRDLFRGLPTPYHFTGTIYYRLALPHILQEKYLLWLDSDMVIHSNMEDICHYLPRHDHILSVCSKGHDKDFNSGVLIINTENYRKHHIMDQCLSYIRRHHHRIAYPDQEALNVVLSPDQLTFFPETYNYGEEALLRRNIRDPKIIHYTGRIKPWMPGCNHPLRHRYYDYLEETPWKDFTRDRGTVYTAIRSMIPFRTWRRMKNLKKWALP